MEESEKGVQQNTKNSFQIQFNFLTSYLGEQSHHIIKFLLLLFFKENAHVIGLSCLLPVYICNLCSCFLRENYRSVCVGAVDSVRSEAICFLFCLQHYWQDIMGSCHTLHLNLKVFFCKLLKVSLFSFSSLLTSELTNSDISEGEKKVTEVNCLHIVKSATYQPYHLVSYCITCRTQTHISKKMEEHHTLSLAYINQCQGNLCLHVLSQMVRLCFCL